MRDELRREDRHHREGMHDDEETKLRIHKNPTLMGAALATAISQRLLDQWEIYAGAGARRAGARGGLKGSKAARVDVKAAMSAFTALRIAHLCQYSPSSGSLLSAASMLVGNIARHV